MRINQFEPANLPQSAAQAKQGSNEGLYRPVLESDEFVVFDVIFLSSLI